MTWLRPVRKKNDSLLIGDLYRFARLASFALFAHGDFTQPNLMVSLRCACRLNPAGDVAAIPISA